MNQTLERIKNFTSEELSRKPQIIIGDNEFDELEREFCNGPVRRNCYGDREMTINGVKVYTHHANRARGIF